MSCNINKVKCVELVSNNGINSCNSTQHIRAYSGFGFGHEEVGTVAVKEKLCSLMFTPSPASLDLHKTCRVPAPELSGVITFLTDQDRWIETNGKEVT